MHDRSVQAADGDLSCAHELILGVERERPEMFPVLASHLCAAKVDHVLWCGNDLTSPAFPSGCTPRELKTGEHPCGPRPPNAGQFDQLFRTHTPQRVGCGMRPQQCRTTFTTNEHTQQIDIRNMLRISGQEQITRISRAVIWAWRHSAHLLPRD